MLKDILSVQVLLKSYGKERGLDVKEAAEIKRLGPMQRRMSAIGVTADNGVFWPAMVCLLLPSRPGVFHPEPLTDPDLTLSRHPARAIARRPPPSIFHRVPPAAGLPNSS